MFSESNPVQNTQTHFKTKTSKRLDSPGDNTASLRARAAERRTSEIDLICICHPGDAINFFSSQSALREYAA
ncbi:hypothetical protein BaRGS_00021055 [Batillaria attramentaria]|uniref:Uncharacterized protein n=1 Tax=Batillaria attramentaria TaxID=370345 RepID=A0ABD0KLA8_9CAEN